MVFSKVCEVLETPRSTVQQWLYDIVGWPRQDSGSNKTLEISDEVFDTLSRIRYYRQLEIGYQEINRILTEPDYDVSAAITRARRRLAEKISQLQQIRETSVALEQFGVEPRDLYAKAGEIPQNSYGVAVMAFAQNEESFPDYDFLIHYTAGGSIRDWIKKIAEYGQDGKDPRDAGTQALVGLIAQEVRQYIPEHPCMFSLWRRQYHPDEPLGRQMAEKYGRRVAEFVCTALNEYPDECKPWDLKVEYNGPLYRMRYLFEKQFPTNSPEVQNEIVRLDCALKGADHFLVSLRKMGELFLKQAVDPDEEDDEEEREYHRFVAEAIKFFCDQNPGTPQ